MKECYEQQQKFMVIKELGLLIVVISSCLLVAMLSVFWEPVQLLQLTDNDDYMRYHQFTSWIKEGNWYLKPLEDFNPEDGLLIHWSRLPDIPLAAITVIATPWLGSNLSESLALTIVPFCYLIALLFAIGTFTYRLGGMEAAKIAILMSVLSPLITKFFPGSIDHHNIQLSLLAWTIAIVPLSKAQALKLHTAWIQGFLIGLSFWVGMENFLVFAIILMMLTLTGYIHSIRFLEYSKHICMSAVAFIALFILINRPATEFFTARYDAISFPFLITLGCGYLFCIISLFSCKHKNFKIIPPLARYLFIAAISFLPILLLFPSILLGGLYHDYPELLKTLWLDNVIEAKSILEYITKFGFFNKFNFLLFVIPALLSIFILPNDKTKTIVYITFCISLLFPLFWQIRTFYASMILAIPLQAIFCERILHQMKNKTIRISFLIFCFPMALPLITNTIPTVVKSYLINNQQAESQTSVDKRNLISVEILNNNNINNSLILAPIDFGAPIIALTENRIISAPYHRNIKGNTLVVKLFSSNDEKFIRETIKNIKIDYVMIGKDNSNNLPSQNSEPSPFFNNLINSEVPDWLSLVEESPSGVKLYKVI